MKLRDVEVICHEGHKSRERPLIVILDGIRRRVEEVVDRWYEGPLKPGPPTVAYFRVRLDDGQVLLLRFIPLFDRWAVIEPDQAAAEPPFSPPSRGPAQIIPFPRKRG